MYKLQSTWGGNGVVYFCTDAKAPTVGEIIELSGMASNGEKRTDKYKVTSIRATGEHWAGVKVEAEKVA